MGSDGQLVCDQNMTKIYFDRLYNIGVCDYRINIFDEAKLEKALETLSNEGLSKKDAINYLTKVKILALLNGKWRRIHWIDKCKKYIRRL